MPEPDDQLFTKFPKEPFFTKTPPCAVADVPAPLTEEYLLADSIPILLESIRKYLPPNLFFDVKELTLNAVKLSVRDSENFHQMRYTLYIVPYFRKKDK
jgi:hypothetical protein